MLCEEEIDWVTVYLNLLDMLHTTSGRKEKFWILYTVQKMQESSENDKFYFKLGKDFTFS